MLPPLEPEAAPGLERSPVLVARDKPLPALLGPPAWRDAVGGGATDATADTEGTTGGGVSTTPGRVRLTPAHGGVGMQPYQLWVLFLFALFP